MIMYQYILVKTKYPVFQAYIAIQVTEESVQKMLFKMNLMLATGPDSIPHP